jgi:hypothetical protein
MASDALLDRKRERCLARVDETFRAHRVLACNERLYRAANAPERNPNAGMGPMRQLITEWMPRRLTRSR